eukprot:gb/GEZN01019862.1/.p1 GENE.gb/GEZN01019862.1/~~gb/GEZN01019862.1/.p1  ORF type:complete len:160 (+),score=25.82 gb/GEZN01019862.1/:80-559(+)
MSQQKDVASMSKEEVKAFLEANDFDEMPASIGFDGAKLMATEKSKLKILVGGRAGMRMYALLHPEEAKADAPTTKAFTEYTAEEVQTWLKSKGLDEDECKSVAGWSGEKLYNHDKQKLKQYIGGRLGMKMYALVHPPEAEPVQMYATPAAPTDSGMRGV